MKYHAISFDRDPPIEKERDDGRVIVLDAKVGSVGKPVGYGDRRFAVVLSIAAGRRHKFHYVLLASERMSDRHERKCAFISDEVGKSLILIGRDNIEIGVDERIVTSDLIRRYPLHSAASL
jgi:hypothetical protein